MHKKWYDYLWIWSILHFVLGFFNIIFQTYLVGAGAASLREAMKLFWTFWEP